MLGVLPSTLALLDATSELLATLCVGTSFVNADLVGAERLELPTYAL
jgi:hypothetical protein